MTAQPPATAWIGGTSPPQNRISRTLATRTFHQSGFLAKSPRRYSLRVRAIKRREKNKKEKAFSQGSRDKTLGGEIKKTLESGIACRWQRYFVVKR